jgi:hypothetical protein
MLKASGRGCIVMNSSVAALTAIATGTLYAMSKGAAHLTLSCLVTVGDICCFSRDKTLWNSQYGLLWAPEKVDILPCYSFTIFFYFFLSLYACCFWDPGHIDSRENSRIVVMLCLLIVCGRVKSTAILFRAVHPCSCYEPIDYQLGVRVGT